MVRSGSIVDVSVGCLRRVRRRPQSQLYRPSARSAAPYPRPAQDARLQPPFVTASGLVVLVTDAMDVTVLPDPATLAPGAPWAPAFVFDAAKYKPLPNTTTYVLAGACLGADDTLYIVDGFSRAVRALALTASGVAELPGSPVVFKTSTRFQFPGTASLLLIADPGGDQLWVPLIGVLGGTAGAAVVIATAAFAGPAPEPAFVPLPGSCVFPLDQGSAALTGRLDFEEDVTGAVLLGSFDCGALATHVDTATGYPSTMWASPPLAFAFGEGHRDAHAHPVFDAPSSSVVFVDYSARYGAPAQLCCARAADWGYCAGWSVTCVNIPSMAYDPDTQMITPWDWIATAVSEDGVAFVAASGACAQLWCGRRRPSQCCLRGNAVAATHAPPSAGRALVNNSHTHSVLVAFSLTGGAVLALLRCVLPARARAHDDDDAS